MSSPINPFGDLQTMMSQFQIPGVDLSAVVESRRKDIDALVAANQAALEAAQALSRKQMDMLSQALKDIQSAARAGTSAMDTQAQAERARQAVERAIADMKELAEIAQHSQKDALETLTTRANEHLQEIRSLVQAGATPPPAGKK